MPVIAAAKALLRGAMLGHDVSVRKLATLTGEVMACHIVVGDLTAD